MSDAAAGNDKDDLELAGPIAPPLANGELIFEAPWQGRVFGMARALSEAGLFAWDEFRSELISAISAWEAEAPANAPYQYYDRFLEALENLLVARGAVAPGELHERVHELEARPHGHDH